MQGRQAWCKGQQQRQKKRKLTCFGNSFVLDFEASFNSLKHNTHWCREVKKKELAKP